MLSLLSHNLGKGALCTSMLDFGGSCGTANFLVIDDHMQPKWSVVTSERHPPAIPGDVSKYVSPKQSMSRKETFLSVLTEGRLSPLVSRHPNPEVAAERQPGKTHGEPYEWPSFCL